MSSNLIPTVIGSDRPYSDIETEKSEFDENNFWKGLHLPLNIEVWSYYSARGVRLAVPSRFLDAGVDGDGETPFNPFDNVSDYAFIKRWLWVNEFSAQVEGDNFYGVRFYGITGSSRRVNPILAYTQFDGRGNARGISRGNAIRTSVIKAAAYYGGITSELGYAQYDPRQGVEYTDIPFDKPRGNDFRVDNEY